MFSVIMPVYNGEKFIDKAIESVRQQTFCDWELIIVNDGSSDSTARILQKYENDEKIHIIHQLNGGVSSARNKGISEASGDYIAFLDVDDIWYENHLEVMNAFIQRYPDAGLFATHAQINLSTGRVITETNYFKNHDETVCLSDFFAEYHKDKSVKNFSPTSTVISKKAIDKVGLFPLGVKIGEDLEHDLRVAAYFPVVISAKVTAVYEKRFSTATKDTSFDPDWSFFDGVKELLCDEEISLQKRQNIKRVMDWFTIRRVRHYIIDGKKKKAWKYFKTKTDNSLFKDKLLTFFLLLMPCKLVKKIFVIRWRNVG